MRLLSHLPQAVTCADEDDLSNLDDLTLLLMIDECEAWRARSQEFAEALSSRPTQVIWDALAAHDHAEVASSCARLAEELKRREIPGKASR